MNIMDQILFATSALHAHGHEWACQLTYNPRLHVGLGLTDGGHQEGLVMPLQTYWYHKRVWGESCTIPTTTTTYTLIAWMKTLVPRPTSSGT